MIAIKHQTLNSVDKTRTHDISSPKENAAAEAMQTLKAAVRNILLLVVVLQLNLWHVLRHVLLANSWQCSCSYSSQHSRVQQSTAQHSTESGGDVAHSWYVWYGVLSFDPEKKLTWTPKLNLTSHKMTVFNFWGKKTVILSEVKFGHWTLYKSV